MNESPLAIGIDFGGTSVKTGVICGGEIIDLAPPIETQDFSGADEIIAAIIRTVGDLRARHEGIRAVGIGVPGFVDFERGVVFDLTNVRGWANIPLRDKLSQALGLPVSADNDANCMAYAEWKLGAGKGYKHLVCAALGTGVGGGIIANGQMVRGAKFGAGEIGGGVARAGDLLFTPFREHLLRQLYGPFRDSLAILPTAFGHEAGTEEAAALALEEAEFQ